MTERLNDLLVEEADGLDVPAPPAGAILHRARGLRRRRQGLVGIAAAAAAVVAIGGVAALTGGDSGTAADPAATTGSAPTFTVGTTLYFGDGHTAEIDDKAVKSIYYTSAGVLVRHGNNSWSDGGGPQRFSLVSPDGTVHPLGLVTEETVHATDPAQPYVVYGQNVDGTLQLVVYDVTADREAARVDVGDTKGNWFPVALDGDTAYVQDGYDGDTYAVQWRTGDVGPSDLSSIWEVAGGHATSASAGHLEVTDLATGKTLLDVAANGSLDLSPDGRFAIVVDEDAGMSGKPTPSDVYDVATGSHVSVPGAAYDWGWTADGDLFKVAGGKLTTCDSVTGDCATTDVDVPDSDGAQNEPACPVRIGKHGEASTGDCEPAPDPAEVRLGGRVYES
ncbi:hypothetical protein [Nocardioides panacisoli]|uniref:WD40 repeat domain-containing protein n=1 Tax=Nocardioides panacisoli TaxID=627624 RepID=A0ABP7I2V8_9ACTN